jgi:uncharacterized RDD family membrane protein YckC
VTHYAGFITRAIAFVIDAAIVNTAAIIFAGAVALGLSVLPGTHDLHGLGIVIAGGAFILWCVVYWASFWSTTGQTPGDRVMHVRVERLDGEPLHVFMAIVRVIATGLAALPLLAGFYPVFFTERRRGVPDWIAGTVVVRTDPELAPLAPAERARPRGTKRLATDLRPDPIGRPLHDGPDDTRNGTVVGVSGLDGDQNGPAPADVDLDLGVGGATADEHAGVQPGDVLGERPAH